MADQVFDGIEDAAVLYGHAQPYVTGDIRANVLKVAALKPDVRNAADCLRYALFGGDLRDKGLAIRIYEKRIDEIKFDLLEQERMIQPESFWDGRTFARFIDAITQVSDVIEDASDYLQIINVSLR